VTDPSPASSLTVVRLGRLAYAAALELQLRAVDRVKATRDTLQPAEFLLLVEHDPPVVTVGRGGSGANVLLSREALAARGVELHESSRGGDVTYHGPGQIVAYPVIDLARHGRDVHRYLRDLEQVVLALLARYGLAGRRDEKYTGVWVGDEKVCAIGVAVTRWITYHGLALNVTTDLSGFGLIVPCGITDRGVTSMTKLLGRPTGVETVVAELIDEFAKVFGFWRVTEAKASAL
jgi:lipoate-protein ligase B